MRVLGFERRLILDSPTLPPWLEWLRIENLRVGDGAATVTVSRLANAAAAVDINDKRGDVTVEVLK